MDRFQSLVSRFHRDVLSQPTSPARPELRSGQLRALLVLEEAIEAAFALAGAGAQTLVHEQLSRTLVKLARARWDGRPSVLGAVGELSDVLVVTYGSFEDLGVDAEPFFLEVMRANFAKMGGPVDDTGKQLKPPGWQPPDLAGVLRAVSDRAQRTCERCGGDSERRGGGAAFLVCDLCHYGEEKKR